MTRSNSKAKISSAHFCLKTTVDHLVRSHIPTYHWEHRHDVLCLPVKSESLLVCITLYRKAPALGRDTISPPIAG
ncbi:hypothetical protein M378DRAFT_164611 [Amanita muscaria Koide BX008]|uniref:Uncharacterized protein n=1 Tax=Amanita muscaria (strain Koide BX008) TaxID=946122 RepID=A0A0C2X3L4_AMAMK|nr:hypothetical protein M378DRAFT_164611 [Amanita muscaria Koide BX008]